MIALRCRFKRRTSAAKSYPSLSATIIQIIIPPRLLANPF
jgi:hypothetical protein